MSAMYGGQELIEDKSCFRAQIGCLCGTSSCRCCCRLCPSVYESTSTRIVYIMFLFFGVSVMALMMSEHVQEAIMEMFPDENQVCIWLGAGEKCEAALGYTAVYRLGFAIAAYHFLLMLITCGVKSSRDCRAGLHNGMWFYKSLILVFLCFGSFFIPDSNHLFINAWMYTAMAGAAIFIIIQLLLLVFLYHSWTDKLAARVQNGGSSLCWYGGVAVAASVTMFLLCACCNFLLVKFFVPEIRCRLNLCFIIVNAAACVLVSVVAVVKRGPKDYRLRLLHSSLVSVYVTYLTWTAIGSAPREHRELTNEDVWIGPGHNVHSDSALPHEKFYCGPKVEDQMMDDILPYISLLVTFITVMYSVVGTASPKSCKAIEFPSCPSKQSLQRHNVEDIGGQKVVRNEATGLTYSYSLFHIMLGLATLYLMMSLTDWYTPFTANLMTFGRSWSAVWIKIISSWVCLIIYFIVTLFPTMLPNNHYRTAPVSVSVINGYAGSLRGSMHSLDDEAAVPLSPSKQTATVHQETTV
ncbi:Serine incorporator 1 [Chionoecetes opilio]|uniref:Serine incorporator 1 n=1 Tax=Chionoecetes opilio TaxID=41210 RepID=A0A8J4YYC0_CHIOP|nr:Serine incorporator 1 [Chionoecetes opilio]